MSVLFFDCGPPATGQKVLLATPAYDSPEASYTYAIAQSREALTNAGIQSGYLLLSGNCHIDDARNSIVREFLASDCTDLVFLDADMSWEPDTLVSLCRFDRDFVGGVYPYRREGEQEKLTGNVLPGAKPDHDGLLPMVGLPTGFMRLRRVVLETLAERARKYRNDGGVVTALLFERTLEGDVRWGGDLSFCKKWLATGGAIYAAPELRLGHVTKTIVSDSLGAFLRRHAGTTMRWVAERIRTSTEDPQCIYHEAFRAVANPLGAADPETLALCVLVARKAIGPIIEAGSGLTTVFMAAANPRVTIHALEHSEHFAAITKAMLESAELENAVVHQAPLTDGWYDLSGIELPTKFAVGLCDGPPRKFGTRMRFYDVFGERCSAIIADDADDQHYASKVAEWARDHGRETSLHGRAMLILKPGIMQLAEAA